MRCSPLFYVSHSHFGIRRNISPTALARWEGGVCVCVCARVCVSACACVCVSFSLCNTQCYSGFTPQRPPLCLLNKENLNQRTDGYGLLPLSPATEMNDRDKHALSLSLSLSLSLTHTHTDTQTSFQSLLSLHVYSDLQVMPPNDVSSIGFFTLLYIHLTVGKTRFRTSNRGWLST